MWIRRFPKYNAIDIFHGALMRRRKVALYWKDTGKLFSNIATDTQVSTKSLFHKLYSYTTGLKLGTMFWSKVNNTFGWVRSTTSTIVSSYLSPTVVRDDSYLTPSSNVPKTNGIDDPDSTKFLENRCDYGVNLINNEMSKYGLGLPKSKQGLYYYGNLSNAQINSLQATFNELAFLSNEMSNQSVVNNWLKWTYKHNILHSHVLKNSHKNTKNTTNDTWFFFEMSYL